MLAPIRDHLSPKDPASSPLLCSTKDRYFSRLSVRIQPGKPGFEEARWIVSEDENVEHLLDVFATIDATSCSVWSACGNFMEHLHWHKPRLVMLGPKIEALADDHPSKFGCLSKLSRLFQAVGNRTERKRLLTLALKLSRGQGDDGQLARALRQLSDVNLQMRLFQEGIEQAKEASKIFERVGDTVEQARCLEVLAWLLHDSEQLDDAEEAACRAIDLLPEKDEEFQVCQCNYLLGSIYRSKGETKKAVHYFEVALGIATPFNWLDQLFWIRFSMAELSSDEDMFDEAHAHVEQAKLHATNGNDAYTLARAMRLQAWFWHRQYRFEEAKSEALGAMEMFEKLGAADDVEYTRRLLQRIGGERLSSWQQFHFSCLLILRSQTGPLNLNHGFGACLEFLECTSPTPPFPLPRVEFANIDTVLHLPTFSPLQACPHPHLLPPPIRTIPYSLFYRSFVIISGIMSIFNVYLIGYL